MFLGASSGMSFGTSSMSSMSGMSFGMSFSKTARALSGVLALACLPAVSLPASLVYAQTAPAQAAPAQVAPAQANQPAQPIQPAQPEIPACIPVKVFSMGEYVGDLCADDAQKQGYTLINFADDWTLPLLENHPELGPDVGTVKYRRNVVALANERLYDAPGSFRAWEDRYFELFGIFPSFATLFARMTDQWRFECHSLVDPAMNEALDYLDTDILKEKPEEGKARQRNLARLFAIGANQPEHDQHREWQLANRRDLQIRGVQQHLFCENLLSYRDMDGILSRTTGQALSWFQRKNLVVAFERLTPETRDVLRTDPHELDYRSALRALRERVVDATGLIEDGSAREQAGMVMGRYLDTDAFRQNLGYAPDPKGAFDLISEATDRAAMELGWYSFEDVREFLGTYLYSHILPKEYTSLSAAELGYAPVFAVKLPPPPAYHSKYMELRGEVNRGDIWQGAPKPGAKTQYRPVLHLYAKMTPGIEESEEITLVRWPTTIGGWMPEKLESGEIVVKYKESRVGPRVWKDMLVTPAWYPPRSTPDNELIWRGANGKYVANVESLGPSYRSAFGMVMLINHQMVPKKKEKKADPNGDPDGDTVVLDADDAQNAQNEENDQYWFWDEGIRVHGSANYRSLMGGNSHGCHRLFNHLALRLGAFLLQHRPYKVRGSLNEPYARTLYAGEQAVTVALKDRGFKYEFTPPIPLKVLTGNVRVGIPVKPPEPKPADAANAADAGTTDAGTTGSTNSTNNTNNTNTGNTDNKPDAGVPSATGTTGTTGTTGANTGTKPSTNSNKPTDTPSPADAGVQKPATKIIEVGPKQP